MKLASAILANTRKPFEQEAQCAFMSARLDKSARRISGRSLAAHNLPLDYMFSWAYPSPHATISSGQIVICTNCASFVCRSFAFTPRVSSTGPDRRLRAREPENDFAQTKDGYLAHFGTT
jgi:hypothetical protein